MRRQANASSNRNEWIGSARWFYAALGLVLIWLALATPVAGQSDPTNKKPSAEQRAKAAGNPEEADKQRALRRARELAQGAKSEKHRKAETQKIRKAGTRETADDDTVKVDSGIGSDLAGAGGSSESKGFGPKNSNAKSRDTNAFSSDRGWVLNTLSALGVVIGLVFLLKWAYGKLAGGKSVSPSSAVEVLCRTSVAPKNQVLLLRVGQRVLVVGDSGQGLRTLSEVVEPEEVASLLQSVTSERENSLSENFSRLFSRYQHEHGEDSAGDAETSRAAKGGDDARVDRTREQVSSLLNRVRSLGNTGKGGVP